MPPHTQGATLKNSGWRMMCLRHGVATGRLCRRSMHPFSRTRASSPPRSVGVNRAVTVLQGPLTSTCGGRQEVEGVEQQTKGLKEAKERLEKELSEMQV